MVIPTPPPQKCLPSNEIYTRKRTNSESERQIDATYAVTTHCNYYNAQIFLIIILNISYVANFFLRSFRKHFPCLWLVSYSTSTLHSRGKEETWFTQYHIRQRRRLRLLCVLYDSCVCLCFTVYMYLYWGSLPPFPGLGGCARARNNINVFIFPPFFCKSYTSR